MTDTPASPETEDESGHYEIRLQGQLAGRWAYLFEGLTLSLEPNGDTLVTGPVVDQAALHGLLKTVRDLGMTLVSVGLVKSGRPKRRKPNRDSRLN